MSQETKRAATVGAATAQSTTDRQGIAFRHGNSTTNRGVVRGQLCFMFDESLPRPQDLARFKNQRADIISWLLDGHSITQDEARYLFNIMRLASRVCELRHAKWNIRKEMIFVGEGGGRVARYWLDRAKPRFEATP